MAFVGVDASGSAQSQRATFEKRLFAINDDLPSGGDILIYRFDRATNEVYEGKMMDAPAFGIKIKDALTDRGQKGTSLLRLGERLNERIAAFPGRPFDVTVLTDCGVELMTPTDHKALTKLAENWADGGAIRTFQVIGLRSLHKDTVRHDLAPLDKKGILRIL